MKLPKYLKTLALSSALIAPLSAQADMYEVLNNVMATINPNAGIVGPVYRHKTKVQDKYGDELAKILIKEAHNKAKRYLAEGNTQAYYAFMGLAFTVPNQEGLMVHFREVPADKDYCNDARSQGKKIKSSKAKKQFQSTLNNRGLLRDRSKGFLVPCNKISGVSTYKQLIVGGSDGSDVGIMQLSALWHYEEYLKEVKYASVQSTVRYGLNYLERQFRSAFRNHKSLGCFKNQRGGIDYQKLIRGSWSAYNGGPSQKCRFADSNSDFAGHDRGFKKNLQKTLDLNNGGVFGFDESLEIKLTPKMRAVVEEIVSNLENGTNVRNQIETIL